VRVEQVGGNAFPHFSVTGEISTAAERRRGDFQVGGCIHDEILAAWPVVWPLVALHLSASPSGEPMHAEANGFYWLAGCVTGGLGEDYHGGSGRGAKTPDECLAILAKHLRLNLPSAELAVSTVAGSSNPKAAFSALVEGLRPRWKAEAAAGLAWLSKEGAK
jgi:hypothetical protein